MTRPLPRPGDLLDDAFQIDRPLGRGGWSTVYAATQLRLRRTVAVKVLSPEHAQDPLLLLRFAQETQLLTELKHPHIVEILDCGTTDAGLPWIAMERVEGASLSQLLRTEPRGLAPARAVRITRQLLGALGAAHARGILHRDIKPSNVMLARYEGAEEIVKLLDFGIAKLIDGDEDGRGIDTIQLGGNIVGSPRYMPPEAFGHLHITPASDLFSVGLLLAELLTGARVLNDPTDIEAVERLARPGPLDLHPALHTSPFLPVLQRALQKQPEDRFPTAADMLQALDAAAALSDLGEPPTEAFDTAAAIAEHDRREAERAGIAAQHGGQGRAADSLDASLPGHTLNLGPKGQRRASLESIARLPDERLPTTRLQAPPPPAPHPKKPPRPPLTWLLLLIGGLLIAGLLALILLLVVFASFSWPPVGHN